MKLAQLYSSWWRGLFLGQVALLCQSLTSKPQENTHIFIFPIFGDVREARILLLKGGRNARVNKRNCARKQEVWGEHCWVRCRHCSDYKAWGASGNYKAQGASGNYEARGASGGKYNRMVIFCLLVAVNRFSQISRKEESHWGKLESHWGKSESHWRKQKAVEESGKPLKKIEFRGRKIGF